MAAAEVLLQRIDVGSGGASSITFSNIPQTGYTDLKVVASVRRDTDSGSGSLRIRFNGATTNYSWRRLSGSGSAAASDGSTSETGIIAGEVGNLSNFANTFPSNEIYISNYTSTNNKTASIEGVTENNGTTAYSIMASGLWASSSAITSVTLLPYGGNFIAGSVLSLYGIAAAGTTPAIAPKAWGGNKIYTDGTYWIHEFTSSGTFTPQTDLSCNYLVVAGGGGGGYTRAGGGGGGGYLSASNFSCAINSALTVTVGAGGVATLTNSTSGSSSTFGSITSTGGGGGSSPADKPGKNGGSGGGGVAGANTTDAAAGTASPSGQGFNGGLGSIPATSNSTGGGGGGAGAAGADGANNQGGNGGVGLANSITGSSVYYAGGGGGGADGVNSSALPGAGGNGGGGAGQKWLSVAAVAGTANRGGGGGGGGGTINVMDGLGANGGSGVVIVRYPIAN